MKNPKASICAIELFGLTSQLAGYAGATSWLKAKRRKLFIDTAVLWMIVYTLGEDTEAGARRLMARIGTHKTRRFPSVER
jgi:hypothetical protein